MRKKILLIEDLPGKAKAIIDVIKYHFPNLIIDQRTSYHTAVETVLKNYEDYFIVLLDMTMSTYDENEDETGGEPEVVAGKRILERMFMRDIPLKVKVVTMYESFDGQRIRDLDRELKMVSPDNYDGYIFFSFDKNEWKQELEAYIRKYYDKDSYNG